MEDGDAYFTNRTAIGQIVQQKFRYFVHDCRHGNM